MHEKVNTFFTTISNGPMAIRKNRRIFLKEQGLSGRRDITMNQVHGNKIVLVDDNYEDGSRCDGLITRRKDVALFCVGADCPPVLFFDPEKDVIAVAHCGRCGTFARIAEKMVVALGKVFGSSPEDLLVSIGPGIGPCCYEVSQEMVDTVANDFGDNFVIGRRIDLQMINRKQLLDVGVKSYHIRVSRVCTMCNKNYYSYRGMEMEIGHIKHIAGIIALR